MTASASPSDHPNDANLNLGWNLENTYANLPEDFFQAVAPFAFPDPQLVIFNHPLAKQLGLTTKEQTDQNLASIFSGRQLPESATTIAQAYAGHQFGGFTMLGDGRAILIGEQKTPDQQRFDIQLKGSGPTPYSRRGDGRATLGPMLREYIISEAMHALGIPTTRSLAVVATGEKVFRQTYLPGAVLTRVASSHIRVGTFQYAAGRGNVQNLKHLADYTIDRHFPELKSADDKYLQFLQSVIQRQATLLARWQSVGFIHGVMNTDNMSICGETIDYGPCAFMDAYNPETVFSSIDQGGRYAYGNQPRIAQWNLSRFAETLLPLLAEQQDQAIDIATAALQLFPQWFDDAWLTAMKQKLGLQKADDGDQILINNLLEWMQQSQADFTRTFTDLTYENCDDARYADPTFQQWLSRWQKRRSIEEKRQSIERMKQSNPTVIPRNLHVEAALDAAVEGDRQRFDDLLTAVTDPFCAPGSYPQFETPPPPDTCFQTFCGT